MNKELFIPKNLDPFKNEMYKHLVEWKLKNITTERAVDNKGEEKYDTFLPESVKMKFPHIYPTVVKDLLNLKKKFDFKFHIFFFHMASSQAANINLFLPILLNENANDILRKLKPDFDCLATEKLYKGFRIEYWDENSKNEKGLLNDHSTAAGTDSDIAIAYYNKKHELCLWLIEHKLTELEFTECGGFKSKGRNKEIHICDKSFNDILTNKDLCYYHNIKKFNYWNLTEKNLSFFKNASTFKQCPFKGGMNQLWRNQLLGIALENEGTFKNVYFSVVKHPKNNSLDKTISSYKELIDNNEKFSVFNSSDFINAAEKINNKDIKNWINWYKDLYML